jgi:hypothetical protein
MLQRVPIILKIKTRKFSDSDQILAELIQIEGETLRSGTQKIVNLYIYIMDIGTNCCEISKKITNNYLLEYILLL